jgi:hypothetical protein
MDIYAYIFLQLIETIGITSFLNQPFHMTKNVEIIIYMLGQCSSEINLNNYGYICIYLSPIN